MDRIDLGEVYHVECGNTKNRPDLSAYSVPVRIKGRIVDTLFSHHLHELSVSSLFLTGLIQLADEHPDCFIKDDVFFYGVNMKRYMDLWIKAGSAYKELGFYHFVTLMGE